MNVDIETLKHDYLEGMPTRELAKKHGVSQGYIYHRIPEWDDVPLRGMKGTGRPRKKPETLEAETSKNPPRRTPRTPRTPTGVSQIVEKENGVLHRQRISEVTEAIEAKGKELRSAQEEGKSKEASDVAAELNALEAELQELSEDSPFDEAAARKVAGSTHKPVDVRSHTRRR